MCYDKSEHICSYFREHAGSITHRGAPKNGSTATKNGSTDLVFKLLLIFGAGRTIIGCS